MDPQALIQQYQEEIAELRSLLRNKEMGLPGDLGMGYASGAGAKGEKGAKKGNGEMEKRLEELKSLILTGGAEGNDDGRAKEVSWDSAS